jgi:hypothetical protein
MHDIEHVPVATPSCTIRPGTAVMCAGHIPEPSIWSGSWCSEAPERTIVGCASNGAALPRSHPDEWTVNPCL